MMDEENKKVDKAEEGIAGLDPVVEKEKKTLSSRLSKAARAYDRGNKGYLTDVEQKVRFYDKDGNGQIDADEVFTIVEDVLKERKQKSLFKKLLVGSGVFFVLLLAANCGLMVAVMRLTREVETDGTDNLVSAGTGQTVVTRAQGSGMTAEADPAYIARIRRRFLGGETNEDRRILQSGPEKAGTVLSSEVEAAYTNFVSHGQQIIVTVKYQGKTYTELIAASGVAFEEDGNTKRYTGFHAQDHETPTFDVECKNQQKKCDVYQNGDILSSRFLQSYSVSAGVRGAPGLLIGASSLFVVFFLSA